MPFAECVSFVLARPAHLTGGAVMLCAKGIMIVTDSQLLT